jgi:orotidine-5'-phosphate decarboxylase
VSLAPFSDRLAAFAEERRSQLCLGLDPTAADAEGAFAECERLIDAAGSACIAAKPQLACFERLGADGWAALEQTVAEARRAELLIVADGKRGDVPHTAAAYAEALLGAAGLGADAATVNPLLGADAIEPFIAAAEANAAGLFALVLTSNPGASDVLELHTESGTVSERIAELLAERSGRLSGESGLSGLGAVVGATNAPERIGRLRELMPDAIFLLPGVGAQGADAGALGPALGAHPASILVPVSRGIASAADPAAAAEALRAELWSLTAAG